MAAKSRRGREWVGEGARVKLAKLKRAVEAL